MHIAERLCFSDLKRIVFFCEPHRGSAMGLVFYVHRQDIDRRVRVQRPARVTCYDML
jgi:hypothetical protein